MKLYKRIIGMSLGLMFLGIGTAIFKISALGNDSVGALIFSVVYLIDKPKFTYFLCYLIVNTIIMIPMLIWARDKIGVSTILSLFLVGFCCDIMLNIFDAVGLEITNIFLRLLCSFSALLIISLGISLYVEADLGVSPYDEIPLLLQKIFPKISYQFTRIMLDVSATLLAFIIGVVILKRTDIINFNTFLSFVGFGPTIVLCSKFVNKCIYKKESKTLK